MKGGTGKLRQRVKRGDFLLSACIMDCRSGAVVEAYHEAGFDYIMVDREHTALNSETILELIRMCRALEVPCVIRVAEPSYAELNRTLDQLPDGIFIPRVRNRAEVERIIEMVKYPPWGKRGLGASTCPAGRYMGWSSPAEMVQTINETTMIGIQIETAEALENLDEILAVPGIDAAVVGNDDLSLGMGIPGQFESPTYRCAVEKVIAACRRRGIMPGIAAGDPQTVRYWAQRGMKMFWTAADICLLWQAAKNKQQEIRQVLNAF